MCIFCKIIDNQIDAKKIYEDENFIAILDISQVTYGHTILISKVHDTNLVESNLNTLNALGTSIKNVSKLLMNKLECKGLNVLSNMYEIAGQTVMHTHIHLIPRYENDGFKLSHINNNINIDEVYKRII